MRIWISKNSEVPIREQLVTQIVLGIVSNDLKVAERGSFNTSHEGISTTVREAH